MNRPVDPDRIQKSLLGQDLDLAEAKILADIMECRELADADQLVEEGGTEATLFLLVDGQLRVASSAQGKPEIVHTMHAGECAGTRAFVDRVERLATITARGPATVYALDPEDLESLLDTHPRVVYRTMRGIFRATHANLDRVYKQAEQLANYVTKTHGRY
ncbi:MAG: cyclic nucleotide-binding domain-containing protein [Xanthomonadales bacterium]|nr:cyclic nucleotide-binding domain-containing protein [Xanthomonadales bacterium]